MEQNKFILGPIQEAWLKRLEEHPERQMRLALGTKLDDGSYKACCLGEGLLVVCEAQGIAPDWREGKLYDASSFDYPTKSYRELGLRNKLGYVKTNIVVNGCAYSNLSRLNDSAMSWPEIAAAIRADPANFFTEPK